MYTLAVKRNFIAQHFLIGGDWGPENDLHSHNYGVELRLGGSELDEHGFLVDIVDVERKLDETIARFRDTVLNDQPEFLKRNPSIEHFSRILCLHMAEEITAKNILSFEICIWEDEIAWTSYKMTR